MSYSSVLIVMPLIYIKVTSVYVSLGVWLIMRTHGTASRGTHWVLEHCTGDYSKVKLWVALSPAGIWKCSSSLFLCLLHGYNSVNSISPETSRLLARPRATLAESCSSAREEQNSPGRSVCIMKSCSRLFLFFISISSFALSVNVCRSLKVNHSCCLGWACWSAAA